MATLFDSVSPHCYLPAVTRQALFESCEWVKTVPGKFAEALVWLNDGYSETAMRDRELADSAQRCRSQLGQLKAGRNAYDTFRRRKALRDGTPRKVLIAQTIADAARCGGRFRDMEYGIYSERQPDDVPVDESNAHLVWEHADEKFCREFQQIKQERIAWDESCIEKAKDLFWRFKEAMREEIAADLPAGQQLRHARRVVLLAAIASSPDQLPLAGEFASVPWQSAGSHYEAMNGGLHVQGRETLFTKQTFGNEEWVIGDWMANWFGTFVARAVAIFVAAGNETAGDIPAAAEPKLGTGATEDPKAVPPPWVSSVLSLRNIGEAMEINWKTAKNKLAEVAALMPEGTRYRVNLDIVASKFSKETAEAIAAFQRPPRKKRDKARR